MKTKCSAIMLEKLFTTPEHGGVAPERESVQGRFCRDELWEPASGFSQNLNGFFRIWPVFLKNEVTLDSFFASALVSGCLLF